MSVSMTALIVTIVVNIIIISPSLWYAGRSIVGEKKAKFSDSVWIVALGVLIGSIVGSVIGRGASIVQLLVWLYLIKTYFETDWFRAFIISCVAVVVFIIMVLVLGIFGLALFKVF